MTEIRPSADELDKARKAAKRETAATLALEAADWLYTTLEMKNEHKEGDKHKRAEGFYNDLDSGVLLCKLINKISPSANCKFTAAAKPKSFPARDNVANFVVAAKALGLNPTLVFDPNDLIDRKNELNVVNALLGLSRLAASKFNIAAPQSVQFEMEIEAIEKEEKEARDKGEIVDEEDTDDTKTEGSVASNDTKDDASSKADETEEPDEPEDAGDDEPEEDEPEADEPVSGGSPAPKGGDGPKHTPPKSKKAKKKIKEKLRAQKLAAKAQASPGKYQAEKGDDIDEALAVLINAKGWSSSIIRKPKGNKKKNKAAARRNKGEYVVGDDKVHIRKIQGDLMVRWQNDWVGIEGFVTERLAAQKK